MEVRALTKTVRISPEKARQIARLIHGKNVDKAMNIVSLSSKKAAGLFKKTLASAIANAENNHDLNRSDLRVKSATVGEGPTLKRFRPRARGAAGRINKRTSHFEIILTDE